MRAVVAACLSLALALSCAGCSLVDVYRGSSGGEYIGGKDRKTAAPTPAPPRTEAAPDPTAEPAQGWTVLIYMNGSDLESAYGMATRDIVEMLTAPASDDVRVILATGGTSAWQNDTIDARRTQYWRVGEDSIELLESLPPSSMGAPETLTAFVRYGIASYPAERTALLLWNHGSGPIVGFGCDELYGCDSLTLPELTKALADAATDRPLYFIGFDACLMASLETAHAVAPYARYMIASEELEPGTGWSYTHLLAALASDPAISIESLFQAISDGMLWNAGQSENADLCTLSLVDLAATGAVEDALAALAVRAQRDLVWPDMARQITQARAGSLIFGGSDPDEGIVDVVDLKDFAYKILPLYPEEGQALISALDAAVLAAGSGRARMAAAGLSIYFPFLDQDNRALFVDLYSNVPIAPAWTDFTASFVAMLEERESHVPPLSVDETALESGVAAIRIDERILDDVGYLFYSLALDLGGGAYLELGHDNDLIVEWDTGYAEANFHGYWVYLNDHVVPFYIIEENEYGNLYNIPALLNGEQVFIRCAWYWDAEGEGGSYHVLGAVRGIDKVTRVVNRQLIPLTDGDIVTPLFSIVDEQGTLLEQFEGDPIHISGQPVLEDFTLITGTYLFGFRIMDWSMNLIGTQYFTIDWEEP